MVGLFGNALAVVVLSQVTKETQMWSYCSFEIICSLLQKEMQQNNCFNQLLIGGDLLKLKVLYLQARLEHDCTLVLENMLTLSYETIAFLYPQKKRHNRQLDQDNLLSMYRNGIPPPYLSHNGSPKKVILYNTANA